MPLELGLFLGARKFGTGTNRSKRCLVFDRGQFRYQEFISDIAGQDIKAHFGCISTLITEVRNWLSSFNPGLGSGSIMGSQHNEFMEDITDICASLNLVKEELTFADYTRVVFAWLEQKEAAG